MTFTFTKATKSASKLRAALFGPSGAGKTFSALRIASGIGGKIAFIDTERGSASKYSDRFDFDVLELPKKDIATYCEAIEAAGQAGYDILIIDSLSHGWQDLLQEVEKLAQAQFKGNTWAAWSKGTPKQQKLVDTILDFPGHVIATMRADTVWESSAESRGKPVRVGLAPKQGKGIEYEFDLLLEISVDHSATVIKDRTGKYQDTVFTPDEAFGNRLAAWLSDGASGERTTDLIKELQAERKAARERGATLEPMNADQAAAMNAVELRAAIENTKALEPASAVA